MNYSKILTYDTANSYGYSVSIWVCGCDRKCKGCFNPEAWDFNSGKELTSEVINKIINELNKPFISKFCILGGEPLNPQNRKAVFDLCKTIKESKVGNKVEIVIYSGYKLEELNIIKEEAELFDWLIDGEFIEEEKVKEADYRGSYNQRCWKIDKEEIKDYSETYFHSFKNIRNDVYEKF